MKGDIATTPSLIKAGADLNAKATSKQSKGVTPLDLAAKSPCRALLKHHTSVLAILAADPSALVSAAIAHCATLSTPEEPIPATRVSLSTAHLEPSFTWAPPASRTAVVGWARGIFIVQLASCTQPFADLPDDCAGDVLEYLEMTVTRTESLQLMPSPYSPKAQAWVRAVIAAAVAVNFIIISSIKLYACWGFHIQYSSPSILFTVSVSSTSDEHNDYFLARSGER